MARRGMILALAALAFGLAWSAAARAAAGGVAGIDFTPGERDFITRLDAPDTQFTASTDPAGGNNDFNNYLRAGPPGCAVLADSEGLRDMFRGSGLPAASRRTASGCFSTMKKPRIDAAIGEFCGGMDLFRPPLAAL